MELDLITQYVLALAPAITSIISMVVALGVGIGHIRKATNLTVSEVKENSKAMSERQSSLEAQLSAVHRENAELKKNLNRVMKKLENVYIKEE